MTEAMLPGTSSREMLVYSGKIIAKIYLDINIEIVPRLGSGEESKQGVVWRSDAVVDDAEKCPNLCERVDVN